MPKTLDELMLQHGLADVKLKDLELSEELEHYGVLGMRWGVRKDRRTGKRVGRPVAGTKAASRSTPSVSPKTSGLKKGRGKITSPTDKLRKSESKSAAPEGTKTRSNSRDLTVDKLNQKQKSKLGSQGLDLGDLSIDQLRATAERLRLENDILRTLDGQTVKDSEMRRVVERIKLEQEYKRLTALPPTRRQVVMKKMLQGGATILEGALREVAKKKVEDFLIEKGLMNPRKKK